jgi:hypothetical protein
MVGGKILKIPSFAVETEQTACYVGGFEESPQGQVPGFVGSVMCVDKTLNSEAAGKPLERMIEAIKAGTFGTFISFDRQGLPVLLG